VTSDEAHKLEKEFQLRRASLADPDPVADDLFLDQLVVCERDATGRFRPGRALTPPERELHREGKLEHTIHGVVATSWRAAQLVAAAVAAERSRAVMAASRAQNEARRLTAEAARLG
jgi:hypothetical protein